MPASVTKPDDCERVAAATAEEFGGIDIVVNSAFRGDPFTPVETSDLDVWRKIFEVNFYGPALMTRACLPALRARGGGSVVMVASQSARKIRPNEAGYAASKGALITLTRSLATELASDHIRVNAVVPGLDLGSERAALRRLADAVAWHHRRRGRRGDHGRDPARRGPAAGGHRGVDRLLRVGHVADDHGQTLDVNGGEFFG